MIRRHFFLFAALVVLVVMAVVGGLKLATAKHADAGGGPQASAQGGGPGGGGRGGAGGGRGGGGPGGFGGAAAVSLISVQPHTFTDAIEVLGVAKGRQSVTLTAAASQLVQAVRFTDGQAVKKGAVLVELKNTEQDAGTAQAEAQLTEARRVYERYKTLGDQGWASKAQVDQYEAALKTAQANVAAAKARQGDRMIRAPFSGVVGLSDVAPGALVNPGSPIVTLDDVSTLRVDFQVPEQYLSQVREGQAIQAVVDAYPGAPFNGHIAKLDTRVDERTRSITARAEFPNTRGKLKPGMLVRIAISRGVRQGQGVPESAVSVQGDSAFVYVVRQQGQRAMAEQRPVVTGLRQNDFVEITDGVRAGEQVVADGLNRIQPGQPVRVTGAGHGGAPGGGGRAGGPRAAVARSGDLPGAGEGRPAA
ncbi:MAG: efflux RND transporter periplasmic adaptor subunit [Caulobacterales bacterium]|nr:efflux RND transporter periplasmic adaptor subunit [Caulobacterales bacterium]